MCTENKVYEQKDILINRTMYDTDFCILISKNNFKTK